MSLSHLYGLFFTQIETYAAVDALFGVYQVNFFLFSGNRSLRTFFPTQGAAVTQGLIDKIFEQIAAHSRPALFVKNVGSVFIGEIADCAEYRIWR
jgi:hypothetical protein